MIRHLAISRDTNFVAAAQFENKVGIWDISKPEKITEFDSILDYGGKRLSLSHNGRYCIAASYKSNEIACYSTVNGEIIWQRENIEKIQKIEIDWDGSKICCNVEAGNCYILGIGDGATVSSLPNKEIICYGQYETIQSINNNKYVLTSSNDNHDFILPIKPPNLMTAAFGKNCFGISECTGGVHIIDTIDHREIINYRPQPGSHILDLGYYEPNNVFYGVEWTYEKGGNKRILQFNLATQEVNSVFNFTSNEPVIAFIPGKANAITSTGLLIDLLHSKIDREIQFA